MNRDFCPKTLILSGLSTFIMVPGLLVYKKKKKPLLMESFGVKLAKLTRDEATWKTGRAASNFYHIMSLRIRFYCLIIDP